LDPRQDKVASVDLDIDGNAKRVARLVLNNKNLERPPPNVGVTPEKDPHFPSWPKANPEYAWRLAPIALRAIDDYAQRLSLPIPRPLTTNHVAWLNLSDNGGWPHCEIELTNGWRFIYRNSMVNGYYAPDNLFNSGKHPILIKTFTGSWKLSEDQAVELVRRTLAKLGPPTNLVHMDFKPLVYKPALPGIPRYSFSWYYEADDDIQSKVEAEVDADRGELKSFYYDDKAYWNHPPPIDVPITLSSNRVANASVTPPPGTPLRKAQPSRPQSAFNPPIPK
jgi:hypothetical protein